MPTSNIKSGLTAITSGFGGVHVADRTDKNPNVYSAIRLKFKDQ